MENLIHNELVVCGYSVDVGVVCSGENGRRTAREIDFIATRGGKKSVSSPPTRWRPMKKLPANRSLFPLRATPSRRSSFAAISVKAGTTKTAISISASRIFCSERRSDADLLSLFVLPARSATKLSFLEPTASSVLILAAPREKTNQNGELLPIGSGSPFLSL